MHHLVLAIRLRRFTESLIKKLTQNIEELVDLQSRATVGKRLVRN